MTEFVELVIEECDGLGPPPQQPDSGPNSLETLRNQQSKDPKGAQSSIRQIQTTKARKSPSFLPQQNRSEADESESAQGDGIKGGKDTSVAGAVPNDNSISQSTKQNSVPINGQISLHNLSNGNLQAQSSNRGTNSESAYAEVVFMAK
jgi:hypothetical protein